MKEGDLGGERKWFVAINVNEVGRGKSKWHVCARHVGKLEMEGGACVRRAAFARYTRYTEGKWVGALPYVCARVPIPKAIREVLMMAKQPYHRVFRPRTQNTAEADFGTYE